MPLPTQAEIPWKRLNSSIEEGIEPPFAEMQPDGFAQLAGSCLVWRPSELELNLPWELGHYGMHLMPTCMDQLLPAVVYDCCENSMKLAKPWPSITQPNPTQLHTMCKNACLRSWPARKNIQDLGSQPKDRCKTLLVVQVKLLNRHS